MASSTRPLAAAVWEALPSGRRSSVERWRREEATAALVLFREETAGGGIPVRVLPSILLGVFLFRDRSIRTLTGAFDAARVEGARGLSLKPLHETFIGSHRIGFGCFSSP